jgi:hypothetical protein
MMKEHSIGGVPMEQWKPVKNYEGFYEVSNLGRVRSTTRTIKAGINYNETCVKKGKILKLSKKRSGYYFFDASVENKVKTITVHRAVATTFIPNEENKPCINHKNAIKTDNRVENLEWVTYKENSEHASMMKLFPTPQKRKILCVEENRIFESSVEAARWLNEEKFKGSKNMMSMARMIRGICCGRRKSAYGYRWKDID